MWNSSTVTPLPYLLHHHMGGICETHLNRLLVIQKRWIRNITSSVFLEHAAPLFEEVELLKTYDIRRINSCLVAWKNRYQDSKTGNVRNTRKSSNLYVKLHRLNLTQRPIIAPNHHNDLPCDIKQVTSFK